MKKLLLLSALAVQGCVSLNIAQDRTLVAKPAPGEQSITVHAHATALCKDFFLFSRCYLYLDQEQVKAAP